MLLPTRIQNVGFYTDNQKINTGTVRSALKIMSVCFPLTTQLPEMHPYSILTSFNTIQIPCLLVLFSIDMMHMHAVENRKIFVINQELF